MNKYSFFTLYSIMRYVIVGVSVFLLDFFLNFLLINVTGINYLIVGYVVAPVVLVTTFLLHRIWSFKDVGSDKGKIRQQGLRYIVLVCFNTVANMFLMYLFYGTLGLPLFFARMASTLTVVIWNFPAYRIWVYRS